MRIIVPAFKADVRPFDPDVICQDVRPHSNPSRPLVSKSSVHRKMLNSRNSCGVATMSAPHPASSRRPVHYVTGAVLTPPPLAPSLLHSIPRLRQIPPPRLLLLPRLLPPPRLSGSWIFFLLLVIFSLESNVKFVNAGNRRQDHGDCDAAKSYTFVVYDADEKGKNDKGNSVHSFCTSPSAQNHQLDQIWNATKKMVDELKQENQQLKQQLRHLRRTMQTNADLGGFNTTRPVGRDCAEIYKMGHTYSGIYSIRMKHKIVKAYCDMEDGGGWTVIQRRMDGSVDFYRDWNDYKNGFGFLEGEHWFGNENIFAMTNQDKYVLRVDLWDWDRGHAYAVYTPFHLENERNHYKIRVGQYSGTAGNAFDATKLHSHRDMMFSTWDRENDKDPTKNCAIALRAGWWYNACSNAHLNGPYWNKGHVGVHDCIDWDTWKGAQYSLRRTVMKIRPLRFWAKAPIISADSTNNDLLYDNKDLHIQAENGLGLSSQGFSVRESSSRLTSASAMRDELADTYKGGSEQLGRKNSLGPLGRPGQIIVKLSDKNSPYRVYTQSPDVSRTSKKEERINRRKESRENKNRNKSKKYSSESTTPSKSYHAPKAAPQGYKPNAALNSAEKLLPEPVFWLLCFLLLC